MRITIARNKSAHNAQKMGMPKAMPLPVAEGFILIYLRLETAVLVGNGKEDGAKQMSAVTLINYEACEGIELLDIETDLQ